MKFASDWKDNAELHNPSEVWCFLLFLATYKGASCFPTNELLDLLEIVYNRRQATDLFGALGLANEASSKYPLSLSLLWLNIAKLSSVVWQLTLIYVVLIIHMFPIPSAS